MALGRPDLEERGKRWQGRREERAGGFDAPVQNETTTYLPTSTHDQSDVCTMVIHDRATKATSLRELEERNRDVSASSFRRLISGMSHPLETSLQLLYFRVPADW